VRPSPTPVHQEAVALLLVALREFLGRNPVGQAIASPADIELEPDALNQPDVFVVPVDEWRRLVRDGFPGRALLLAVEVLSPSSSRYDRVMKRLLYHRHVPEYWIIDLDARLVERWRPSDERPEVLTDVLDWNPRGASEVFRLDLTAFLAGVFGER